MRTMIDTGKIIPCRWTESRIYVRIREMHPRTTSLPRPTREEIAIVGDFVNGMCDDVTADNPDVSGQAAIESWLARDCGGCHARPADAGAIPSVPLDIAGLLADGELVPCSGSPLLQRLRDNSMPPPGVSPRPTAGEIQDLEALINRTCSGL